MKQMPKTDDGEPMKRVYLMTIYRDPVEWLASSFFEWMCKLRNRIEEAYAGLYPDKPTPKISPKYDPYCWNMTNLTVLADYWIQHTLPEQCGDRSIPMEKKRHCSTYLKTGQDPSPQCRSVQDFLESSIFNDQMKIHPKYLIQPNGSENSTEEPIVVVEKRAFERFGGLVPHAKAPMRWIGLTERYDEGLVLFYDWLGVTIDESLGSEPKLRYKSCRPTSFWTEEEQEMILEAVGPSRAVHNVANAIIDARLQEWCCRRRHQLLSQANKNDAVYQRFCVGETAILAH